MCDTEWVGEWSVVEAELSAARTEHATRVARRLGLPSAAALPSWVLELIRDCLHDGRRIAHEAPTIPPRRRGPGEYSLADPSEDEVTRVERCRRR